MSGRKQITPADDWQHSHVLNLERSSTPRFSWAQPLQEMHNTSEIHPNMDILVEDCGQQRTLEVPGKAPKFACLSDPTGSWELLLSIPSWLTALTNC